MKKSIMFGVRKSAQKLRFRGRGVNHSHRFEGKSDFLEI